LTVFLLLDIGMVDRERDIDYDRHLRPQRRGANERASTTIGDLFLSGRNGDHLRLARLLGVAPESFENCERTNPVVDRARRNARIWQLDCSRIRAPFSRSSGRMMWIGIFPTTPITSPWRPLNRMRCPTRTCGSQPPIGAM